MADRIKLVALGSGSVGKSALVMRLVNDNFLDFYDPTIEDCHHRDLVVDDKVYHLDLLDTAGQQDFHSMEDGWFQIGDGVLLVYSIVSKTSFIEVSNTYNRLVRAREIPPPVILCGNKSDLAYMREVSSAEGAKLAQKLGCPFFETSAKLSKNEEVFAALVRLVCKVKEEQQATTPKKKKERSTCVLL